MEISVERAPQRCCFFSPSTLQHWESRLKEVTKLAELGPVDDEAIGPAYEVDGFSLNMSDGILEPVLNEPIVIPTYLTSAYLLTTVLPPSL